MFNTMGLSKGLTLSKVIGGISKTLQIANQVIPLYQKAKPMISNARSVLSVLKGMNKPKIIEAADAKVTNPLPNKKTEIKKEEETTTPTFFL